ncbi:MAG TPA: hypothetical protein VL995_09890 [Cellvibrio sp.]|nr:hypothetical protein [Cellvibrio sp.]
MAPKPYDADSVLKRYDVLQQQDDEEEKEHTLQENAKERAKHPEHLNAGTPYDWEDVDRYREELDRLDREGPGRKKE